MTVLSEESRKEYVGNGTLDTYVYTWQIYTKDDNKVYVAGALKTVDIHYTVTGVLNPGGGNIIFTAGNIPANLASIVIYLDLLLIQAIDYKEGDKFPAETHEKGLDRLTKIVQNLKEKLYRCLKLPSYSLGSGELPTDFIANYFLKVNSTGKGFELHAGNPYSSPAGANQEIQINDNGILGADPELTWDKTTERLYVNDIVVGETRADVRHSRYAGGAKIDGVTDDSASFLAALAAADYVHVPPGIAIVKALTFPAGHSVKLKGSGRNLSILKRPAASTDKILTVTQTHQYSEFGSEISGLSFHGNDTAANIIEIAGTTLLRMEDLRITNSTHTGLKMTDCIDGSHRSVNLEYCGDPTHPQIWFHQGNNNHFFNLHSETWDRHCTLLKLTGTAGSYNHKANFYYGLKLHQDMNEVYGNLPLLTLDQYVKENDFFGAIVSWGIGTSQIECDGAHNSFYAPIFGGGGSDYAVKFTVNSSRNIIYNPNIETVYNTKVFNFEGFDDRIILPLMGLGITSTNLYDGAGKHHVEYYDEGGYGVHQVDTSREYSLLSDKTFHQPAAAAAPTDAKMQASQITFYLDETGHNLKVRVKYSDGTTLKTGTVTLA